MSVAPSRAITFAKLGLVAVIWGGTFIAGRVVTAEMPAAQAALWRYLVASVAMLGALLLLERRWPALTWRQGAGIAVLGATGVLAYNLCFMQGLKTVSASRGALIIALNPVITTLGAWAFFRDHMAVRKAAGVIVALAGAAVVISHGSPAALLHGALGRGEALLLGSVLSWVTYTLVGTRLLHGLSPVAAATYAAWAGTAMLALVALASGDGLAAPQVSARAWMAIAYLGVIGTAVAFVWYYEGVHAIGPAAAAVFINLVPVSAVLLGVVLLGESIDVATLAGGALVVAGVVLINRAPAARGDAVTEEAPCG